MKAAVLRDAPGRLAIEDLQISAIGEHEVLVRVAASGLCHSDLHFIDGQLSYPLPAVMGHESAGVVEAVGSSVSYVSPGDHVITSPPWCGTCVTCVAGRGYRCVNRSAIDRPLRLADSEAEHVNQFAQLGGFAEQLLVHENSLVKIPKEMPLDRAAVVGCAVMTGVGAVFNTAKVQPGSTVAVIGCGGIGLNIVQGAVLAGASRVIAIDRVPQKLELARVFGATDGVDASKEDASAAVLELTGGGVDHAFEAVGLAATTEQAWQMLGMFGTATVAGALPTGTKITLGADGLMAEKRIQGCSMGSGRFRIDMPSFIDLYLKGRLKVDELLSGRIRLDQVNEGYEQLKTGEAARNVIVFD